MRYFAKIEDGDKVSQVVLVEDHVLDPTFFLSEELGLGGEWVETWIDGGLRRHFAACGSDYNRALDVFISEKLYDYFVLDEEEMRWVPPVAAPYPEGNYYWDDEKREWVLKVISLDDILLDTPTETSDLES